MVAAAYTKGLFLLLICQFWILILYTICYRSYVYWARDSLARWCFAIGAHLLLNFHVFIQIDGAHAHNI